MKGLWRLAASVSGVAGGLFAFLIGNAATSSTYQSLASGVPDWGTVPVSLLPHVMLAASLGFEGLQDLQLKLIAVLAMVTYFAPPLVVSTCLRQRFLALVFSASLVVYAAITIWRVREIYFAETAYSRSAAIISTTFSTLLPAFSVIAGTSLGVVVHRKLFAHSRPPRTAGASPPNPSLQRTPPG